MNILAGMFGLPDWLLPVLLVVGFGLIITGVVIKIRDKKRQAREDAEALAEEENENADY